jgi:hypothetical protein
MLSHSLQITGLLFFQRMVPKDADHYTSFSSTVQFRTAVALQEKPILLGGSFGQAWGSGFFMQDEVAWDPPKRNGLWNTTRGGRKGA